MARQKQRRPASLSPSLSLFLPPGGCFTASVHTARSPPGVRRSTVHTVHRRGAAGSGLQGAWPVDSTDPRRRSRGLGVPKEALSSVGAGRQGGGFRVSGLTFISLEVHLGHGQRCDRPLAVSLRPLSGSAPCAREITQAALLHPNRTPSKTRGPRQPVPRHHTGNSNYNNVAVACAGRQAEV